MWEFLLFLLAWRQKQGVVCCMSLLEEKLFAEISTIRKIDRLFPKLSEYLKAGAGVLLLCVLMLTEEQNIFLTCLKSHADRCSYSSVSCILCASKTVFFK